MNNKLSSPQLQNFEKSVAPLRAQLLTHPIYENLRDLPSLRIFMKYHVFAVWDFMSLLKSLQRNLTCVDIPWAPRPNSRTARFINEIVLAEETDEISAGHYLSHFELYLEAMHEVGADTRPIMSLLKLVAEKKFDLSQAKIGVWDFMSTTFSLAACAPHEVAAAFLFGREDIIPEMFQKILNELPGHETTSLQNFRRYLERHIEIDGEEHGPLARNMLIELCGNDDAKWAGAAEAALTSIEARIHLWDFVNRELATAVGPAQAQP